MAEIKIKIPDFDMEAIKKAAVKGGQELKKNAAKAGEVIADKAGEVKDAANDIKEDIDEKRKKVDIILENEITEYNDAYTQMNDKGYKLYMERTQSVDSIGFVENLVNSIANTPKEFDSDFETIKTNKANFVDARDFADRELQNARTAAVGAGAGLAAGASVAFMAPTAAMWIATTFGTASTGAAISSLSGAAAANAALAWLGGGAVAVGGGGMAAGHALLAMAGPVGWGVAGAYLLGAIILFNRKNEKIAKQKNEQIEAIKKNTESVREMDLSIDKILSETIKIRNGVNQQFNDAMTLAGKDYGEFTITEKKLLGALVNNTKSLSEQMKIIITEGES